MPGTAPVADTASTAVVEVVDDTAVLAIPGAMHAGVGSRVLRGSLATALARAFVVTVPVDEWLIGRGRGRAAVHAHPGTGR